MRWKCWPEALLFAALAAAGVPAHAASAQEYRLEAGGLERSYRVHRPASANAAAALPLLVVFHGGFGTGAKVEDVTGFDALADRESFLVAYPDGVARSWNAGERCCDPARKRGVDGIGFTRALIARLAQDYRVDPRRVYATGFSNGAMLLHRIACQAPDLFAAVAIHSGAIMTGDCAAARPLPVLLIHGKLDPRIPWNGGTQRAGGFSEPTYRAPFMDVVAEVARRNRCGTQQKPLDVDCHAYAGCAADLEWCGIDDLGHQWAGGKTVLPGMLGKNSAGFDASRVIWEFFKNHPRAAQSQ